MHDSFSKLASADERADLILIRGIKIVLDISTDSKAQPWQQVIL